MFAVPFLEGVYAAGSYAALAAGSVVSVLSPSSGAGILLAESGYPVAAATFNTAVRVGAAGALGATAVGLGAVIRNNDSAPVNHHLGSLPNRGMTDLKRVIAGALETPEVKRVRRDELTRATPSKASDAPVFYKKWRVRFTNARRTVAGRRRGRGRRRRFTVG